MGHNEPAWMREEAPPAALPSTTMGGPPMVPVHGETTPLRGACCCARGCRVTALRSDSIRFDSIRCDSTRSPLSDLSHLTSL